MDDQIRLEVLPKDTDRWIEAIDQDLLAIARSKNDFLYIIREKDCFRMFSHTPGSPSGGQKTLTRDKKNTAIVRNLANVADTLFSVSFSKNMDLYGVMASAEEGILSAFPGNDRDADEDIEFVIPNNSKEGANDNGRSGS